MIVVSIIGVLASIIVVEELGARDRAKDAKIIEYIHQLSIGEELYGYSVNPLSYINPVIASPSSSVPHVSDIARMYSEITTLAENGEVASFGSAAAWAIVVKMPSGQSGGGYYADNNGGCFFEWSDAAFDFSSSAPCGGIPAGAAQSSNGDTGGGNVGGGNVGGGNVGGEEPGLTTGFPWTSYAGSHYLAASWAGVVRDHKYGIEYDSSSHSYPYTELDTSTQSTISGILSGHDAIFLIGGFGSGRGKDQVADYMNSIESDSGASWRQSVQNRVIELDHLNTGRNKLVIQVGNEITSDKPSENLHLWKGDGKPGKFFDPETIPWYVEYYLAPTVSGLRSAGPSLLSGVEVALGSMTVYSNSNAEPFLDSLLNYQIQGTYAPELSGKKVSDIVDIITLHYFMSSEVWESRLDHIRNTWIGTGEVNGVWSSEECGIQAATNGSGGVAALKVTARYLRWTALHGYAPGLVRGLFYGWDSGPSGNRVDTALSEWYGFFGDSAVKSMDPTSGPYVYPFSSVDDPKKKLAVAWTLSGTLQTFSFPKGAWVVPPGDIHATVSVYGPSGHSTRTPSIAELGSDYVVTLDSPVTSDDAILFMAEIQ